MSRIHFAVLVAAALLVPIAAADGLLPINPITNGDFDTAVTPGGVGPARPVLDRCIGIGHQGLNPLFSSYGDWSLALINDGAADPTTVATKATGATFADDATGYPIAAAGGYAGNPDSILGCDPNFNDLAQPNPWNSLRDDGFMWSNDPATSFLDVTGDGDTEAVIPSVPAQHSHSLWQSIATSTQAFSADFDAFQFTVESGSLPASANVQVGLSLTPSYMQSPWVVAFWEGAVYFTSADLVPDASGRVSVNPVAKGEIICPAAYTPCEEFRADYNAADAVGKATLLGQTRIVQTSFWSFNNPAGPVVLDDIAYLGAKSFAETVPNAGNV
jgi:hypothetical protein